MRNQLIVEKILYYHRRNQERIGEVELKKQQQIHSCNLMRNCILTELSNFSQSVMAFKRNDGHQHLYPEDKEFLTVTLTNYMRKIMSQERKGYDR